MSETHLIKPAVRDVVAERLLKAKEQGVVDRAAEKIEQREKKAQDAFQCYYDALEKILDVRFSFKFRRENSSLDELKEYDRFTRREARKSVAWCVTIVPLFYFVFQFLYVCGTSYLGSCLDTSLGRSVSLLKHRKYFLRDMARREQVEGK